MKAHETTQTRKLELRILEALWSQGRPPCGRFRQAFPEPRPAYTTITNTVYRMEAKKAVRRVRKIGNADIFEPLIAKDTARDGLLDEILSFFGGRPQPMMAQLIESGKLTLDDIRELEKAAAELTGSEKRKGAEIEMTTPFIVNHLWQSSCFALLAGLLAFVLRKNSPKVRYWVWLSASLKFLVPFALLVSLGSVVPRPASTPGIRCGSGFPEHLRSNRGTILAGLYAHVPEHAPLHWVPLAIAVVWALGFLAIALARCRSWLRVRAAMRAGTPVELPIPVRAVITPGAEEPGIVGFLRPVLVLPAGAPGAPESSTA